MNGWRKKSGELCQIFETLSEIRSNPTREILRREPLAYRLKHLALRCSRRRVISNFFRSSALKISTDTSRAIPSASSSSANIHESLGLSAVFPRSSMDEYRVLLKKHRFIEAFDFRHAEMIGFADSANIPEDSISLELKLWALFELNQIENAVKEFEIRRELWSRNSIEIGAMCYQLLGDVSRAGTLRNMVRMFHGGEAFDSGQKIGVFGPQEDFYAQKFRENPEVVVEMNPTEPRLLHPDQEHVGYYSGSEAAHFQNRTSAGLPRLAVAKVMSVPDGLTIMRAGLMGRIWLAHSAEAVIPRAWGTAQGLQRALYDLLWTFPESISVTGVDFFISGLRSYRTGYQKVALTRAQIMDSLIEHDPFTNYYFVKTLLLRGLVRSPVKVLLGEPRDYAEKLSTAASEE